MCIRDRSYSAPLENRRNLLRLDFNENTLGPSKKVYEAIKDIKLNQISIYPEYNLLKEFLCNKYHDSREFYPEEIGLFNGADAAINFFCFLKVQNKIAYLLSPLSV